MKILKNFKMFFAKHQQKIFNINKATILVTDTLAYITSLLIILSACLNKNNTILWFFFLIICIGLPALIKNFNKLYYYFFKDSTQVEISSFLSLDTYAMMINISFFTLSFSVGRGLLLYSILQLIYIGSVVLLIKDFQLKTRKESLKEIEKNKNTELLFNALHIQKTMQN